MSKYMIDRSLAKALRDDRNAQSQNMAAYLITLQNQSHARASLNGANNTNPRTASLVGCCLLPVNLTRQLVGSKHQHPTLGAQSAGPSLCLPRSNQTFSSCHANKMPIIGSNYAPLASQDQTQPQFVVQIESCFHLDSKSNMPWTRILKGFDADVEVLFHRVPSVFI